MIISTVAVRKDTQNSFLYDSMTAVRKVGHTELVPVRLHTAVRKDTPDLVPVPHKTAQRPLTMSSTQIKKVLLAKPADWDA